MLCLVLLMDSLRRWVSHSSVHLEWHRLSSILCKCLSWWRVEIAWTKVWSILLLSMNELFKCTLTESSHCVLKLVALSSIWIEKLSNHWIILLSIKIILSGILSVNLWSVIGIRIEVGVFWGKHLLALEVIESWFVWRTRAPCSSDRRVAITCEVVKPHRWFTSRLIVSSCLAIQIILIASKSSFILIQIIALHWAIVQSRIASISYHPRIPASLPSAYLYW